MDGGYRVIIEVDAAAGGIGFPGTEEPEDGGYRGTADNFIAQYEGEHQFLPGYLYIRLVKGSQIKTLKLWRKGYEKMEGCSFNRCAHCHGLCVDRMSAAATPSTPGYHRSICYSFT
jgi:hypothetical protein